MRVPTGYFGLLDRRNLPPRLLSFALRGLIALQRRRLGPLGDALAKAARLELDEVEAVAELAIDDLRRDLRGDQRRLEVEDHGAGTRGLVAREDKPTGRRVSDIYRRAAATPAWGRFLFLLSRALRPCCVLEMGTSLGVSAAHLAAGLALNEAEGAAPARLVTVEGDPGLAALARSHLEGLGHAGRTDVITGRFEDVLRLVIDARGPFDLVFVDGHHEEAATIAYWAILRPGLKEGACVAFDDIEPGRPVRRAWKRIVATETARGARAVDLLGLGLLFLPHEGAARELAASELGATPIGQ